MSPHLKWPSRILFGASLLAVAYLLGRWQTAHEKSEHQSSPEIVAKSSSQLLDKLKMVNELHTAMGIVQTIVTSSQDSKIFGMSVGSTKLLYVAVGQVRAGIDLAKLNPSAITVENNHLHLTIPPPEILDTKLDLENSYVYDLSKSMVLAPDGITLQSDAQKRAMESITAAAVKCGVLDAAGQQAKTVLSAILMMAGFDSIDVTFSPTPPQLSPEENSSPKP